MTSVRESSGRSAEEVEAVVSRTPYRLVRFLGRGGMGEVWVVEHRVLKRRFALKVLHAHLGRLADRMRVEAETMGRLAHANVVDVVDFWTTDDGRPCIVMELLQGRTLWQELAERRALTLLEALDIACQCLAALGVAHELGVVHRDIKPENLFLHDAPGGGRVLKVLDFGLVRVMPEASRYELAPPSIRTATGAVIGSPRFMSPEAARGERVDLRADLFSVGVVLYVMLTGTGPFDTDAPAPEPPSHVAEGKVPPEFDAVVLRAIREQADERYQSAHEFLSALAPFSRALTPPNFTQLTFRREVIP